ncbi:MULTISPECIES: pyridoxal 5'-phosphate synthase [Streptomyces]|uniref:pyridoxine/pyridoxamine 5'-phosphate oxidase n=1 Tax=Streptomyces TaxID=1883 RepID=UPI000AB2A237|nr:MULTISPECIES: pyridoxal 5'-phosphate synthase [Streptomyces]MDI5912386.1 pyridoxal 5'-phosphate synthase [Streptomyces sp. 12257]
MPETMRDKLRSIPVFADVGGGRFQGYGLPDNPLSAIGEWILAAGAAGQPEPHSMSLCTVDASGVPSSRVLIVKDIDDDSLFFATPSDSRKGLDIAANPHVAAHFHWPVTGRQVRIAGTAADQGRTASERDFAERGRGSRLAAHLHRPGPLPDRQAALDELERLETLYPGVVPCPATWTLYAITPTEVEFWEASTDRVHYRVMYRRDTTGTGWRHELLWP